jgi:Rrf2 family transcriptional regulator, cysteine metabolism repressor
MRLSAKVEYACLAALELALRYQKNAPVQVSEIAGSQDIPEKFLIQLFQRLKAAQIVSSARGVTGGYFLAKNPAEISLADVIRAVDNTLLGSYGEEEMADGSKGRELVLRAWRSISDDVADELERITLEALAKKLSNEKMTYYI